MNTPILTIQTWQDLANELPWGPKQAERSAIIVLSKAYQFDISKEFAIQSILKLPAASHLKDNPHILYAAWEQVSREMSGESMPLLESEAILGCAA